MPEPDEVQLGDITVPAYPQKIGRLKRLGRGLTTGFEDGSLVTADAVVDAVGDGTYETLCIFYPKLSERMSREEFLAEDTSPTVPQVRNAFATAMRVNGLEDLPGIVGKALGPAMTQYLRATALEKAVDSIDSATSPSTSGTSASPTSTPTSQTSTASSDSPSPASTD